MRSTAARFAVRAFLVPLLPLVLSACGTGVFPINFAVSIDDPAGTVGAPPTQVSVFDPTMGDTRDWARKFMGQTSPGNPYLTTFQTSATKMVFDSGPPPEVSAGLAIPAYTDRGYFRFVIRPVAGQSQTIKPGFIPYLEFDPSGRAIATPTLEVLPTAAEKGWDLKVTVVLPDTRSPAAGAAPSDASTAPGATTPTGKPAARPSPTSPVPTPPKA
jgi:hypothetical protein